jgi:hypothetical protein
VTERQIWRFLVRFSDGTYIRASVSAGDKQRGCLGLGLMAVGFAAIAIGLLLWGGSSLAKSDTPPLVIAHSRQNVL